MSRHLTLVAFVALSGAALGACDAQSTLSKAKPGECYSVVGRDALGVAKIAKTPCAGSPAALAAACPKPAAPAPSSAAACPGPGTKVHAAAAKTARKSVRRAVHVARRESGGGYAAVDDGVAKSGEVTSLGIDYARVGEELAGGYYERRDDYARVDHGPPPPRPSHRSARGASIEYSERSRESRAYSESYSSSSHGYGQAGCDCDGRGAPPHSPFDEFGYLTWRGKTPG